MTMTDFQPPAPTTEPSNGHTPPPTLEPCPVPGCTASMPINALGPHLAMHRRNGDPGTPPAKGKPKGGKRGRPPGSKSRPKVQAPLEPSDLADGVLAVLYPVAVPRERVREVAAWISETDRLAAAALADTAEPS